MSVNGRGRRSAVTICPDKKQRDTVATVKPESQAAASCAEAKEMRGLPSGWRWVTLKGIADIAGGLTKGQKRRPHETVRSVPYLRVANVQRGYINLSEVKEIDATEPEIESLRLQPGDILFNEGGDRDKLGRGWVWNGELPECIHQNHVFRARVRDSANSPKFISYYGNSAGQRYFYDQGKHTTNLASINLTKLGALPIPLPPPCEQWRIVAEIEKQFTRLEAGVAALRRVQANLKRYRAAVLKAACEGKLVQTEAELQKSEARGQKSKAKFETGEALLARILTERRKNWQGRGQYREPTGPDTANLPAIPSAWAWASLDQLIGLMRNGISTKPDAESGLPILRISAVRALAVNLAEARYLNASASRYSDYVLTEGDLLFTRYNGNPELVGVCGVVPPLASPLVHPDKLIRCKLVTTGALPDFVAIMANVGASRDYLAKRVRTTAGQAGISGGDLKGLPIPLAPLAEQSRIVAEVERRLSVVEELEAVVAANLQRAARLRQAILQKAFEGKLVPREVGA